MTSSRTSRAVSVLTTFIEPSPPCCPQYLLWIKRNGPLILFVTSTAISTQSRKRAHTETTTIRTNDTTKMSTRVSHTPLQRPQYLRALCGSATFLGPPISSSAMIWKCQESFLSVHTPSECSSMRYYCSHCCTVLVLIPNASPPRLSLSLSS